MNESRAEAPLTVVIDPGLLVHEILTPQARTVCMAWRNGRIVPVFTRRTLDHTLLLLRDAGVQRDVLEIWALWLTRKDRSVVVASTSAGGPIIQEYASAVVQAQARGLVTDRPEDLAGKLPPDVPLLTPQALAGMIPDISPS